MAVDKTINGTPSGLIPKMGEFPISNSTFYQQLLITDAPVDTTDISKLDEQIDPFFQTQLEYAEDLPAVGVLLTFEQGWFLEGIALGELRKSLTLAPGEVTKIATVDWRRTLASRDESSRDQIEAASADTADASAAVTVQRAVLQETTNGSGFNMGSSTQAEGSVSGGGLLWGASMASSSNSTLGFSAASSTGSRNASADAAASISRKTAQHAQAARSTRATQIREVTESESQSTSTRVIANYNHAHALTMQYYEVLQIYTLKTEVVRADRCVFVPVEPLSFTAEAMLNRSDKQIELLRRTVRELGLNELDELIGEFHDSSPGLTEKLAAAEKDLDALKKTIETTELNLTSATEKRNTAVEHHHSVQIQFSELQRMVETRKQQIEDRVRQPVEPPAWGLFNERERLRHEARVSAQRNREWTIIQREFQTDSELLSLAAKEPKIKNDLADANRLLREASKHEAGLQTELNKARADLRSSMKVIESARATLNEHHRLFGLLEKQKLLLNQQMWMRVDPHIWHGLLADSTFPSATDLSRSSTTLSALDGEQLTANTERARQDDPLPAVPVDHEYAGQPIGGLINPQPIGVFGNYVAFIWDFPKEANDSAKAFERRYVDDPTSSAAKASIQTQIALPTEGIFAEAVLGQSNSAEKIDLTRFWNWQDSPIPILPPEMNPVSSESRARDVLLPKALEFEKAIAALQDASAEDLTDTSKLLETLRNTVGPDMRSLANAASEAGIKASQNASQGADRATQRTLEVQKSQLDTVIGLANSDVVKQVGGALSGGLGGSSGSGGLSSLGGLLNHADTGSGGGGVSSVVKQIGSKIPKKGAV